MITPKIIISLLFTNILIFLFLFGCGNSGNSLIKKNKRLYKDVTIQEASMLIKDNTENENFIILDVRTPQEYKSGHLKDALNIDYNSPAFKDSLSTLDKDKTYLLYCRTGRRSLNAFTIMKEMGFKKVYHMIGGIAAWTRDELPTAK